MSENDGRTMTTPAAQPQDVTGGGVPYAEEGECECEFCSPEPEPIPAPWERTGDDEHDLRPLSMSGPEQQAE